MTVPVFDVVGTNNAAMDTGALLSAIASAQAAGCGEVRPHGPCAISSSLVITSNITIRGDGIDNTWILPTSSNFDAISFNPVGVTLAQGVNPQYGQRATITIEGLSIQFPSIQTSSNVGIRLQAQNNCITQPIIRDVGIYNAPTGISVVDPVGGLIDNCKIENFDAVGIVLDSPTSPDGGGMVVRDTVVTNYQGFNATTGVGSGTGIFWKSGGAFTVDNCGFSDLYDGLRAYIGGSSTQCSIIGTKFDTTTNTSIRLGRQNSNVSFATVLIDHCEMATSVGLYVEPDPFGGQWLSDVTFGNNIVRGPSGAATSLVLVNSMSGLYAHGNTLIASTNGAVAFNIAASVSDIYLGPNKRKGAFAANIVPGSATIINPT